jgi:hypothetical protein
LYRYETNDPWIGGDNGNANINFRKLGNRTQYLKQFADEVAEAREGETSLKARIQKRGTGAVSVLSQFGYIADEPVAASTANVDITAGGLLEIDGIQTSAGDLVFLKDQTDRKENGYWEAQTGAWNRYAGYTAADHDCFTCKFIPVNRGAENSGKTFFLDVDAYTIGTDALTFLESIFTSWEIPNKVPIRDRRGRSRDTETLTHWKEGQNLLDVLEVNTIADAMAALRTRCNGTGKPDFSGLRIGDYFDLPSLTIAGTTYQWSDSYQNLRVILSGFNQYKGAGDQENSKNHILFTFRNCVLTKRMNASNDNAGGYAATELRTFLESDFKIGLQAVLGDYIYPTRRLLSTKGGWAWETDTVFLPTEYEVMGCAVWAEIGYGGGFQSQFPLFRESCEYLVKRYNGARQWYWLASPAASSALYFCGITTSGHAHNTHASSVGGVAPAFCVA